MPLPAVILAGLDRPVVSHTVAVFDRPGEHIRDRFNSPMRMPGETRQIVFGLFVAEIIEQ